MKNPFKLLKGLKMTLKFIIGVSVVGIAFVAVTTVAVTKYNSVKQVADTEALAKKEKEQLSDITKINGTSPGIQPAQSSGVNGSDGTSSSPTKPGSNSSQTPTSNSSTPSGGSTTTPSPTPPVNTNPMNNDTPQVTLTYPYYWGQVVTGVININATASDANGVQKVVFMIRKIGVATPLYSFTDTTAPYSTSFNTATLPNGSSDHTVEAQVFDNLGQGNLTSLRINVQN